MVKKLTSILSIRDGHCLMEADFVLHEEFQNLVFNGNTLINSESSGLNDNDSM